MAKIYLVTLLLIVLSIDMFLFLGQLGVAAANPDTTTSLIGSQGAFIEKYNTGTTSNPIVRGANESGLPEQNLVVGTSTDLFTDIFNVLKGFFKTIGDGANYLFQIVSGPVNYIKILHLPDPVAFAIGAFWYSLSLFIFIAFITGRD